MRGLVLYTLLSLDGVAEAPNDFVFTFDDEMRANLAAVIGRQDTVLLGRRTHDEWAAHWPASDEEPFASFINTVPKHVASRTPLTTSWAGATRVTAPIEQHVRELKKQAGGEIGLHGSIELARGLLTAGLVDEIRLVVAPALAGGGGKRLDVKTRLSLVSSRNTSSGALLLHYRTT
jgi:dihydrofolate reductase